MVSRPESSWPVGATGTLCVMGDPVKHSLSPAIHNAALSHLGLDFAYLAFEVNERQLGAAMAGVRALGISGVSITMPHKEAVIQHLDEVSLRAQRLSSVNVVYRSGDRLMGDSTDGAALVDALRFECQASLEECRVGVVGTGGAARAIVLALGEAGTKEIAVVGRSPEHVRATAELSWQARSATMADLSSCDILINATSVGMASTPQASMSSIPLDVISQSQLVYDIIYSPAMTPLLVAASSAGARTSNGVSMLVHQAARAFQYWTGLEAPLDVMQAAAVEQLANVSL